MTTIEEYEKEYAEFELYMQKVQEFEKQGNNRNLPDDEFFAKLKSFKYGRNS